MKVFFNQLINNRFLHTGLMALVLLIALSGHRSQSSSYRMHLSEYGFFEGDLADLKPAAGVVPYQLNTPLFTDYAEKARFVRLPKGKVAKYNPEKVFDFPVGTALIKNFYYYHDARKPEKGRRIMETRVLLRQEEGWKALPYIWDEEQTEATLEVAGGRIDHKWVDANGKKRKFEYVVPNMNQCKGCHSYEGEFTPIGPSARQLNGDLAYAEGSQNQLAFWAQHSMLEGLPSDPAAIPRLPIWNDPSSGSLDQRARAWLEINCAHCHNPAGPAHTSGLFLEYNQTDATALGIMKPPVAAGRGSGGLQFGIMPGHPEKSILFYRINSADPGVMMPELGRKLIHEEGVELIREWIAGMEG